LTIFGRRWLGKKKKAAAETGRLVGIFYKPLTFIILTLLMLPIITFIGWHNSGKTTLVTKVVAHLKERGYRVAVIKSTKETGIAFDAPGTDTARHRQAGADTVLLVAPDQMTMVTGKTDDTLIDLAQRFCADVDLVIGEGFKRAAGVPKIEVRREEAQPLLREQVQGVIAMATDLVVPDVPGCARFRLDQGLELADFIERYFYLRDRQ
jgi:molybdopterin-guanine dinucleotide biosynthesis adapter protein